MSHEQQTQKADTAPGARSIPESVRLTLLATVTGRMIELRKSEPDAVRAFELSRLIPAAQWLTGEAEGGSGAKH
ncbi:hypothetical protein [Kushneria phyllosphaerae]|uniref:Uncharacterized protein n=1 Tax=Kushneria phyllosphaerae TaxID=2100822 RepID=A0A2R8CQQ4_9GAMM|nr:hypothetical protein [Kushneria phyllosphaerae]SPJ35220.1 hypothetical protein KSP9073_03278 [Kushneria phyllosphaerae]